MRRTCWPPRRAGGSQPATGSGCPSSPPRPCATRRCPRSGRVPVRRVARTASSRSRSRRARSCKSGSSRADRKLGQEKCGPGFLSARLEPDVLVRASRAPVERIENQDHIFLALEVGKLHFLLALILEGEIGSGLSYSNRHRSSLFFLRFSSASR